MCWIPLSTKTKVIPPVVFEKSANLVIFSHFDLCSDLDYRLNVTEKNELKAAKDALVHTKIKVNYSSAP